MGLRICFGAAAAWLYRSATEVETMIRKSDWPYRAALLTACGLYLTACALPATKDWQTTNMAGGSKHYVTELGLMCLLSGWLDAIDGLVSGSLGRLTWLANPLTLVGAVLLRYRRPTGAAAFGAAGVVAGLLYSHMLVQGRRAPVVGLVTMDMTMLDVTDLPCEIGDAATALGADGSESITAEELATLADCSPYELLCGLRLRMARRYFDGDVPVVLAGAAS